MSVLTCDSCAAQVFDHPSVKAITSYISTLGLASAGTPADVLVDSDDDTESESALSTVDYQLGAAQTLQQLARSPAAALTAPQASLIGISSLACKTAAGNAVMRLPGVDASSRVPFCRWEVERQEQVSGCASHDCDRRSSLGMSTPAKNATYARRLLS